MRAASSRATSAALPSPIMPTPSWMRRKCLLRLPSKPADARIDFALLGHARRASRQSGDFLYCRVAPKNFTYRCPQNRHDPLGSYGSRCRPLPCGGDRGQDDLGERRSPRRPLTAPRGARAVEGADQRKADTLEDAVARRLQIAFAARQTRQITRMPSLPRPVGLAFDQRGDRVAVLACG